MPSTSAPTMNSTAHDGRRARQHGRAAARAERRLARAAAKRVGDVAALALLQQDDQHQHQADEHVERRYAGNTASALDRPVQRTAQTLDYTSRRRRLRVTISKNPRTSRLAPPTSAPSTSGCATRSLMLSGLTLPP